MIEIRDLVKYYGDICAVDHVSFSVEEGEILGFLGPNGAGKTTTMNILTGYLSATSGTVLVNGHDILENPHEAKKCIGYLPEHPPLYLDMTVTEFLQFVAELKGVPKELRIRQMAEIMKLVRITDVAGRLIKNLSKGYRQRVGIAQALVGNPQVLVLDEPTVGLDPKQIIEIRNLIKELGQRHTVILSSHILPEVQAVCERVVIINKGKIAAVDTPAGLSRKMTSTSRLQLSVEGPSKEIVQKLRLIPGIHKAELFTEKEENISVIEVENEPETDVRRQIFYEMARNSWPIIEMKSLDPTLEEIFLQVTGNYQEGKRG
ncbi:MAG: ATP-binding cassette domain-containing protein [Clostridia bacterium]|nr:ATP-binding cassette domain-containing protein [Eubacteriales bacterium]MDD4461528.1 ATP-binding cassette domain-containing protein [Eubacteriales bacterium]NCC48816.1 ATP-binding cassette domain-containing protein [Clostridia bacterium]